MLNLVTTAHPSLYDHPGPEGAPIHPCLGRLIQPRHTSSIERTAQAGIPWAADNDCFQGLDAEAFCAMLDRIAGLPGCLFVTVPDVIRMTDRGPVGDALATLEQFDKWAPALERRGLPVALVAQDGLEQLRRLIPWHRVAALFVGGSTEWKLGAHARDIAQEARERGRWVHWGRVNTRRRMEYVSATGAADSFDGTTWCRWRRTHLDAGLAYCLQLDRGGRLFEPFAIAA